MVKDDDEDDKVVKDEDEDEDEARPWMRAVWTLSRMARRSRSWAFSAESSSRRSCCWALKETNKKGGKPTSRERAWAFR